MALPVKGDALRLTWRHVNVGWDILAQSLDWFRYTENSSAPWQAWQTMVAKQRDFKCPCLKYEEKYIAYILLHLMWQGVFVLERWVYFHSWNVIL